MFVLVLYYFITNTAGQHENREIRYLQVPNLSSFEECKALAEKWVKLDEFSGATCLPTLRHYL
jgi:hypothetical protein